MKKTVTIDGVTYDLVPKEVEKVMGSIYHIEEGYNSGIYILCRTSPSDWRLISPSGYRWSDNTLEHDIEHNDAVKVANSLKEYLKENTL